MRYTLSEIAALVGGKRSGCDREVTGVAYDSRRLSETRQVLFVAIRGAVRDGHAYVPELAGRGVRAFMVNDSFDTSGFGPETGFVVVRDTLAALQRLAAAHRQRMHMPVAAIVGSSGKTVVKEWISQVWSGGRLFRSPRSYNSQIGVALSLLMLRGDEELAVLETGVSMPGEMASLRRMVKPDLVLVTNIGEAHQENFGSYEQKLREKLEMAGESRTIVFPGDNGLVAGGVRALYPEKRLFSWGTGDDADVRVLEHSASHIRFAFDGRQYTVPLEVNDRHTYENILSVIAFYAALGYDLSRVCRACVRLEGVEVRLKLKNGINGSTVISDGSTNDRNALRIALDSVASMTLDQPKVAVLSDLAQPGVSEEETYAGLAEYLETCGLERVIAVGTSISEHLGSYRGDIAFYETPEAFLSGLSKEDFREKAVLVLGNAPQFARIAAALEEKRHTTVLEVDLSAMVHNLKYYRSRIGKKVRVTTMVKAFSYGSGSYDVARALVNEGVDYLAVAYLDEGIALREHGIAAPVIILNSNVNDYELILDNDLQPEIYSLHTLRRFVRAVRERGFRRYPIHLKLDTGMTRLGFGEEELPEVRKILQETDAVAVESVFSHFSSSDMPENDAETRRQIGKFEAMSARLPHKLRHLCNSAGIERFPQAHYDMVRLGIGLYGISPLGDQRYLENVNSLYTTVLQVREVKAGTYIGYGMRGCAERDMKVATVSIGYADGLHRVFGNGRWAMKVGGAAAPIIGNICMDTCMIDVTGLPVREGDPVAVFSSAEDICRMAEIAGTIPYEILTSVSARIKRVYVRE